MSHVAAENTAASWIRKPRVLFLAHISAPCTHMAEGYLRAAVGQYLEITSAALRLRPVYPLAHEVMDEDGINIRSIRPEAIKPELMKWADRAILLTIDPDPLLELLPKDSVVPTTWLIDQPKPDDRESYFKTRDIIKQRVMAFANAVGLANRR